MAGGTLFRASPSSAFLCLFHFVFSHLLLATFHSPLPTLSPFQLPVNLSTCQLVFPLSTSSTLSTFQLIANSSTNHHLHILRQHRSCSYAFINHLQYPLPLLA